MRERFGRGTATRWDSPNTVDVRAVSNAKNISFYISKYITKKSEHSLNPVVSSRESSDSNLRLWFCSRSLSRLESKLEVTLLERTTRKLKLTQEGQQFLAHARKILNDLNAAEEALLQR